MTSRTDDSIPADAPHPKPVAAPRTGGSPPRRTVVAAPTAKEAQVLAPILRRGRQRRDKAA
jgi:hypothetical protein